MTYIQIVLSERNDAGVEDQGVLSPRTWRVADLHTKHMMLRAGLGWGNLPEHVAREDLESRRLVAIWPAAWGEDELILYMSAISRKDTTSGPAHRWILKTLEELSRSHAPAAETQDISRSNGGRKAEKSRRMRRANATKPRQARSK
ncbi:MAG TPA: LysR substrate-binding domain-containing protein [Labilithrix sp.]|nr:LysR substrate-binding domain-containing protein [Labilithrix sp.]